MFSDGVDYDHQRLGDRSLREVSRLWTVEVDAYLSLQVEDRWRWIPVLRLGALVVQRRPSAFDEFGDDLHHVRISLRGLSVRADRIQDN